MVQVTDLKSVIALLSLKISAMTIKIELLKFMKFQSLKYVKLSIIEYKPFLIHWASSKEPEDKLFFVAILSLKTFKDLYSASFLSSPRTEWLVNLPQEKMKEFYFPFSSQVYSLNIEETNIAIKEHYNIVQERSTENQIINKIGIWENKESFTFTKTYIWERRKDFRGHQFVAETLDQPPYAKFKLTEDGTVDHIEGTR